MKLAFPIIMAITTSIISCASNAQENTNTNIASTSKIFTSPYIGAATFKFTDGEVDTLDNNELLTTTPLAIKHNSKLKLKLRLKFNSSQSINKIRLYQTKATNRNYATSYTLSYKKTSNNSHKIIAAKELNAVPYKWYEYNFSPPIYTDSIFITPEKLSSNKGPSYGGGLFSEIEIYTNDNKQVKTPKSNIPDTLEIDNSNPIKIPSDITINKPWKEQFQKGIFSSIWYYEEQEKSPYLKHPKYIPILKDIGVTRIWLYLNLYRNKNEAIFPNHAMSNTDTEKHLKKTDNKTLVVPFKNDYVPYINSSTIDKVINRLHDNNIGIIANEPFLPIKNNSWGFPRIFDPINYPCILSSTTLHNIATNYYNTLLDKNFDGISIGGDEFFFYGHKSHNETQSLLCKSMKDKNCDSSFKKSFKKYYPLKNQLNDVNILTHEYNLLAKLFKKLSTKIKSKEAISTALFLTGNNNRQSFGIAHDIIGHESGLDELSIDPYWAHNSYLDTSYFSIETKKILAAIPNRNGHITLQTTPAFNSKPFVDDIMIYGPAIASIMNGISGINFYKIDHLFHNRLKSPTYTRVKKIFNLIRFLENNNFTKFKPPKHIALLYSRSAEDEWQMNNKPDNSYRAVLFQNAIIQSLIKRSIPFDIYYLDQASTIPDLSHYDLTLIPFNHSMDKLTPLKLNFAKKTLIFQMTNVNQNIKTTSRKLKTATSQEKYQYSINLDNMNFQELSDFIYKKIITTNGSPSPLSTKSISDTECNLLKNSGDYLMYCINWGKKDAEINVNMDIPDSTYNVWSFNTDSLTPLKIKQNKILTQDQLKDFNIKIDKRSFRIFLFDELNISGKHEWRTN